MLSRMARECRVWIVILICVCVVPAHAAPIRVLPPPSSTAAPRVQCVTEFLIERLAECKGIDIVRGARTAAVNQWFQSGAYELSEAESWNRLESFVAIDAMISVVGVSEEGTKDAPGATVEVRIYRHGGMTTIKASAPDSPSPELMKATVSLGERLGRELKLSDADIKVLSEPRIDDPTVFRLNYTTKNLWASWAANPFTASMIYVASIQSTKSGPAFDAVCVWISANYIYWGTHGRSNDKLQQAMTLGRSCVLRLLGTPQERAADAFLRMPRADAEATLAGLETTLLQIAQPLATGITASAPGVSESDLEELGSVKADEKGKLKEAISTPSELSASTGQTTFTPAQQASALRMLGVMKSSRAMTLFKTTSQSSDAAIREITATALANQKNEIGLDLLTKLADDKDERVALAATISLVARGRAPSDFQKRLVDAMGKAEPLRTQAALALASFPALSDEALITRLAADESSAVRAAIRRTRTARAGAPKLADVLRDPDADAIVAALRAVKPETIKVGDDTFAQIARLANDPDDAVAQAARDVAASLRPKDVEGQAKFDLSIAVPYTRQKVVEKLKTNSEPWARAELIRACENMDAHTRVAALRALVELDPAAARAPVLKALSDLHLYVRFHAAVFLSRIADASQTAAIRDALPRQKDRATVLYLKDTLTRIAGDVPPPPQPPANLVSGPDTVVWFCGALLTNVESPYRMNFKPSHGNHVRDDPIGDAIQKAHAAGRVYFYNVGPLGETGQNLIDRSLQDRAWLYLDDQLDTAALPFIDGVDFMTGGFSPDALWPAGWRIFCEEIGIDPARVAGDRKKLGENEADAWRAWATRCCVEARNQLHDYAKLKFGRLHPGFQLLTSISDPADPSIFDLKFDVATVARDSSDPRRDYANIRRIKTLWPDRPLFWHTEGLTMPPSVTAVMKWDFVPTTKPLIGRGYSAYADALTAWMAGAEPGWSTTWCFRRWNWGGDPDFSGYSITPEAAVFESKALRAAIEFAFEGAEPAIRERDAFKKASDKGPAPPQDEKEVQIEGLVESITKPEAAHAITDGIARDKERLYLGFQFYGKHLLDIARVFASLPRTPRQFDALVIRSGTREDTADSAGVELLSGFDCVGHINHVARVDLKRYKFIAVDEPEGLTDQAIAALTKWLKETPGVLYVHLDLAADNAKPFGTPEQFDGKLKLDWPWENDLSIGAAITKGKPAALKLESPNGAFTLPDNRLARPIKITAPAAKTVLSSGAAPALVVWQSADFKGAVVFDVVEKSAQSLRNELRRTLRALKAQSGVGIDLADVSLHESLTDDRWIMDTTSGPEPKTISGVDLLTGELNPVVGPEKSAALVGKNFTGKFAASYNGISVLCDAPIRKIEKIEGGLRVECDGLIQAASATGKLETKADGKQPAEINDANRIHWVMLENTEGIAAETIGDGKNSSLSSRVYIRCKRPVSIVTR